jgi:hypothetical protein
LWIAPEGLNALSKDSVGLKILPKSLRQRLPAISDTDNQNAVAVEEKQENSSADQ